MTRIEKSRTEATQPGEHATSARRVHATILFADLAGFTSLVEELGPERAYSLTTGCLQLLDGIAAEAITSCHCPGSPSEGPRI